jgi:hypothetical protein
MTFLLLAVALGIVLLPVTAVVIPVMLALWLAFALLRLIFKVVIGVVLLPIMAVVFGVGVVVAGIGLVLAVLVPLAPLALAVFLVWTIVRLVNRPARTIA